MSENAIQPANDFQYTYPLVFFANFAGAVFRNVSVNEIFHRRNLASPTDPGVSEPNVDTLYSRVVLDLSSHDLVLTVPDTADGIYWNYPVYDVFSNQLVNIGVVDGNKAGNYLIRRAEDVYAAPGYEDTSATCNATHGYQGIVNLPGSYGTMLIRLEVVQNTTSDLERLHIYQNASSLVAKIRTTTIQVAPSLKSVALNGSFLGIESPAQQLELAARIVQYNQPVVYSDRYRVASILAQAGLYNDHYHKIDNVNLIQVAKIANDSITADVSDPAHTRYQGNGYYLQIPSYQGYYGTHYMLQQPT